MKVFVPATSANLGSGFDSLGLALELKNEVFIKPAKFHSVSLKGEGSNRPALKDNNMFINIFNDFYRNLSQKRQFFRFEFFNEIPLSRGLGSSSAVIVSAITCAYAILGLQISKQKILNLALAYESHPDNITPAVMGGFTSACVDDNEVSYIRKTIPKDLASVVVIPNRPISTNLSRKSLPLKYSLEEVAFNISHASLLSAAFMCEDWEKLRFASRDKIHQDYRIRQMPELFEVQKVALKEGALMSTLSGSGSSFFSLVYTNEQNKILGTLKKKFPHFRALGLAFDNVGVRIED